MHFNAVIELCIDLAVPILDIGFAEYQKERLKATYIYWPLHNIILQHVASCIRKTVIYIMGYLLGKLKLL